MPTRRSGNRGTCWRRPARRSSRSPISCRCSISAVAFSTGGAPTRTRTAPPGSNGRLLRRRRRTISSAPPWSPRRRTNTSPRTTVLRPRTGRNMPSRTLQPEIQYATLEQQSETAQLGIWLFLMTETLFFGALLLGYTVLRHAYPEGFAEAGKETKIVIGTVNTAVLLTSSAIMAWAVHAAEIGHRRLLTRLLATTAGLGIVFLALKGLEYSQEYKE